MLSELGIVGLLLFGGFLVAGTVAGLRSRRSAPAAAALSAAALTAVAYWIVHASYDWFWHYPGITAPVLFMFGAAAAPAPPAGSRVLKRADDEVLRRGFQGCGRCRHRRAWHRIRAGI